MVGPPSSTVERLGGWHVSQGRLAATAGVVDWRVLARRPRQTRSRPSPRRPHAALARRVESARCGGCPRPSAARQEGLNMSSAAKSWPFIVDNYILLVVGTVAA